jgi:hypothetical protein
VKKTPKRTPARAKGVAGKSPKIKGTPARKSSASPRSSSKKGGKRRLLRADLVPERQQGAHIVTLFHKDVNLQHVKVSPVSTIKNTKMSSQSIFTFHYFPARAHYCCHAVTLSLSSSEVLKCPMRSHLLALFCRSHATLCGLTGLCRGGEAPRVVSSISPIARHGVHT